MRSQKWRAVISNKSSRASPKSLFSLLVINMTFSAWLNASNTNTQENGSDLPHCFIPFFTAIPQCFPDFANSKANLTAGTSSSSFNIGGSGPKGVMLKGLIFFHSLVLILSTMKLNLPEYDSWCNEPWYGQTASCPWMPPRSNITSSAICGCVDSRIWCPECSS